MSIDVSIIIPTFNRISLLKKALESIYAQKYSGTYEIIVIDDASQDGTSEMISKEHPDICLISLSENVGHGTARNHGIRHVKGKYVAFLDSDDLWKPDYLEIQISSLQNQNRCFAVSGIEVLNMKNNERSESTQKPNDKHFISPLHRLLIFRKGFIKTPSCVVIPKYIFDEIGLFEERFRYGIDIDYYVRCLGAGYSIIFTELPLVIYRFGLDDQLTKGKNLSAREKCVHARTDKFYTLYGAANHDKVPSKKSILIENYLSFGYCYLLAKQPFNSIRAFWDAARYGAPLRAFNLFLFAMKLNLEKVKKYAAKGLSSKGARN